MKFNVIWIIQGPGGQVEAPNTVQGIPATDLPEMLRSVANSIPTKMNLGLKIIGVRIMEVSEPTAVIEIDRIADNTCTM